MTKVSMTACPVCGLDVSTTDAGCPGCGIDLKGYWRIYLRPFVHHNRALDFAAAGRFERAAGWAESAVDLNPRRVQFRLSLARILLHLGELDEAMDQVHAALQHDPNSEEADRLMDTLCELKARATAESNCREDT